MPQEDETEASEMLHEMKMKGKEKLTYKIAISSLVKEFTWAEGAVHWTCPPLSNRAGIFTYIPCARAWMIVKRALCSAGLREVWDWLYS